jgi:hypothetical protein
MNALKNIAQNAAGHVRQGKDCFIPKPGVRQIKERRNVSADAHGMPMHRASAHLIASSWTSANTFRRSLDCESRPFFLNLTRMAAGRLFAVLLLGLTRLSGADPAAAFLAVEERPVLRSESIKEASGLAMSSRDSRFLWLVNDSGSEPALHLVETSGVDRGKVTLAHAKNTDWEDLASFSLDGRVFLLVADTGDNDAKRDFCTLHVLREPELPAVGKKLDGFTRAERTIRFRFEGGPRDCEAVAVDVPNKKILLLSKRTDPPEVHELPLVPPDTRGVITTRKIGVTQVSAPTDSVIPFRDQPTGFDLSSDNSLAAVVTYYGVFVFPRKPGESWAEAFAGKPAILSPHRLAQAESVAISKDNQSIIVVSEGRNSKIVSYQKIRRQD